VLKDVRITPQLGRHLLGRVNPIFAHLAAIEGTVSLSLKDVTLPLSEEIKRRGAGQGHLDLANLKVRPGGFSALLLELGGLGEQEMQTVTVDGVDFVMKDGRVAYQNMRMKFPSDFDLIFRGSVGFDDTMELWVSVPVKPALLAKFGVRGAVQEYARYLTGTRIEIPIRGTRLQPKLDLSRVDIKPLVEKAMREAVKGQAGKLLDNLGKPPPSGAQPPAQQAPAAPGPKPKNLLEELLPEKNRKAPPKKPER